ncbi:sigma 54-interacting transcriptional regulator [Stenotrophobium rhamnosiphilum]|uniref:Two-component system response regulator GlrR n=1 Tax=Stenotrophobium rhamnosiphilum TaxID=2029166 RepID=A0A2T5MD30_9GAMM|nr:sigma 54-interacting transcriptional regulator [Stenotrophobium rhamnosiphilum]PTU30483.1 two-component system response regulator GlrR [Stenotrophobium rhamnosiphilum]
METAKRRILLVDDDPDMLRLLSIRLRAHNYDTDCAKDAAEAINMIYSFRPDLIISDLRMPVTDGMELLTEVQRLHPGLPMILLTAHGTIPDAVAATHRGAFDFLTKPVDKEALLAVVEKAMQLSGGSIAVDPSRSKKWREEIVTMHPVMLQLLEDAHRVASSETSVMIMGESGTGKELLARAIHKASPRASKEFIAVNCGAIPENLLESELFGHEKGAFTGAIREHEGLFRAADGGTLLLDEIGDMPLPLQVKLLRVLQERQVRPVGSVKSFPVNVRILSATHRDLKYAMEEEKFRADLYYRLNVVGLRMPSLSERVSDIPILVSRYLAALAERSGERCKVYAPEAMELLVAAAWPGNVRQLFNIVEQNVALSVTPVIGARIVQKALGSEFSALPTFAQARDDFTRAYLTQLLQITGGNISQASRMAERNRTEFYKLLSRFGLNPALFKSES